jgi:hypothetical protein
VNKGKIAGQLVHGRAYSDERVPGVEEEPVPTSDA